MELDYTNSTQTLSAKLLSWSLARFAAYNNTLNGVNGIKRLN